MDGDNFREDDQVSQSIFKERKTLWSARRFVDDKSNRFTFKNSPLDITIILIEMVQVSCINFYYILCDLIVNAASNGKHDYILWREFYRLFFFLFFIIIIIIFICSWITRNYRTKRYHRKNDTTRIKIAFVCLWKFEEFCWRRNEWYRYSWTTYGFILANLRRWSLKYFFNQFRIIQKTCLNTIVW